MKWIRFFGNFEGRIPRKTFWLANIAVFIIEVIVTALIAAAVDELAGQTAGDVATHILTLAFFYPQFVIAPKRAHDLDVSSQIIYAGTSRWRLITGSSVSPCGCGSVSVRVFFHWSGWHLPMRSSSPSASPAWCC